MNTCRCDNISLAGGPENARQSADAQVEPQINMTLEKASRFAGSRLQLKV